MDKVISTSRIEDFPGVVILADEQNIITEEQMNDLVKEYSIDDAAFGISFSKWLKKKDKT